MKHRSGSAAEWRKRREAYKASSGPISNPGDGRMRAKERRMNAERRVLARAAHGLAVQRLLDGVSKEAQ